MAKRRPFKRRYTTRASRQITFFRLVLLLCSILLFIYAFVQLKERHAAVSSVPRLPSATDVIRTDIGEPEESKPETRDYSVSADQPRRILLPTIVAEGIIQKVALTADHAIAVPSNVNFAGWYTESAKPGEQGLSIIDGHVSGRYTDGVFKNIHKLRAGDNFSVEYGDLRLVNFEVIEVKSLPESESLSYLLEKRQAIDGQLNLITCGGKFNKQTSTFADRVIVVAKRI